MLSHVNHSADEGPDGRMSHLAGEWCLVDDLPTDLWCWINFSSSILFSSLWFLILVYTASALRAGRGGFHPAAAATRLRMHHLRWVSALLLCLIHWADVADIAIVHRQPLASTYPAIFSSVVVLFSCLYYDKIEVWRKGSYLFWLCPYWLLLCIGTGMRISSSLPVWRTQHPVSTQLIITCVKLLLSSALLLLDGVTCFRELRRGDSRESGIIHPELKAIPEDVKTASLTESTDSVFSSTPSSLRVTFDSGGDAQVTTTTSSNRKECYLHPVSNLLSQATFNWLNPLLWRGYWKPLEQEDLGPIPASEKSIRLGNRLGRFIRMQVASAGTQKLSLWRCYWSFSWPSILLGGCLKFSGDLVGYVAPLGIEVIVNYLNTSSTGEGDGQVDVSTIDQFISNGYVMAAIVFVSSLLQGTLSQASSHVLSVEGVRLKTALQSLMYQKSLRLSASGHQQVNDDVNDEDDVNLDAGSFSQLLTEDCGNVMVFLCLCHYMWAIPLKCGILLYLLYKRLGTASVIASVACLLLTLPLQFVLGQHISRTNKQSMKETDRRLRHIHEWLSNMKLFRLYAWERSGQKRIEQVRRKELDFLWHYSLQWAWATFLTQASTVILTLLTFVLYPYFRPEGSEATSSIPDAAQALSGLALINQFTVPLSIIPVIVPDLIAARNSTIRLVEFFRKPEVVGIGDQKHTPAASNSDASGDVTAPMMTSVGRRSLDNIDENDEEPHGADDVIVHATGASFSWPSGGYDVPTDDVTTGDERSFVLRDINLKIRRGTLTVVVGHVGTGKSSLLLALLGELDLDGGHVTWSPPTKQHNCGYVAQRPWLMQASLRDNILFGSQMNAKRYGKVLEACALSDDVALMERKDSTLIGSRGTNVSGGQKSRIALARAIYSTANTLLLDDPFAALDVSVAQHVFHNAVQRLLLKQQRNVVMTTHHMHYAASADQVIVMDNGRIVVQGTPGHVSSIWPELNQTSQNHPEVDEVESNRPAGKSTAMNHWNKLRLVTKTGYLFKSAARERNHSLIDPEVSNSQRWRRLSSRMNSLSLQMSHDLLLFMDESIAEHFEEGSPFNRQRAKSISTRTSNFIRFRRRLRSLTTSVTADEPLTNHRRLPASKQHNSSASLSLQAVVSMQPSGGSSPQFSTISPDDDHDTTGANVSGFQRMVSTVSGFSVDVNSDEDAERGLLTDPTAADEERQYGRVPRRLYLVYAQSCGLLLTVAYFIGSFAWQGARLFTDYWLVIYQIENQQQQPVLLNESQDNSNSANYYLIIYIGLSVASIATALLTNVLGQAAGSQGRRRLHDDLLSSLCKCHTSLFDMEPTGRLLNRFNSDMAMIDKKLATTFQRLVQFVLMCLSAIVVNVIITPWSLIIASVIVAVFYVLQRIFRTSARELQRLESLTKAPVVSHLTETLSGLSTLRAFGQQQRFLQTMYEQLDTHTATVLVLNSTNRWLGFAVDSLGAAAVLVTTLMALLFHRHYPQHITAGQVGLAINYTLMTPIYLQWVVRFWSELEMYFNALQRVLHYSQLRQENQLSQRAQQTAPAPLEGRAEWPVEGHIELRDVSIAYRPCLQPVVTGVNLRVRHGEKIGICGRTGSGKSTLVNAIFRLADVVSGSILIDNVDISTVEPHYLRSRLTTVPQDTLIIAGTLRDNLDPEHQLPDQEIYQVLEAVHLKEVLGATSLDTELWKGGGCNLSVGQQQLLSLARAALRPSPILILDEPSSALDQEAENILHYCLDHLFHNRTILLVAHDVSSLRKCDRVCLIEDGKLMMEGSPDQVLNRLQKISEEH